MKYHSQGGGGGSRFKTHWEKKSDNMTKKLPFFIYFSTISTFKETASITIGIKT
jgi:hypothetical protein